MFEKRAPLSRPQNSTSVNPENALSRPLSNFKSLVLRVAAERLKRPLTVAEVDQIEECLMEKTSLLSHTPDHPPYAAMLRTALQELNEKGGSSEESVSNFIIKEFPDLPYAHCEYLKHHLSTLCNSGEIVVKSENHYVLFDENAPNTELKKRRGKQPKRDEAEKRDNGKEKMEINDLEIVVRDEQNIVFEEHNKHIEEWDSNTEVREVYEEEGQPLKQMKIKLRLSENKPRTETMVSYLPLAIVENVEKTSERQLSSDRNIKPEVASTTTALILKLAQSKSQPQETVKCRGRGRPRKIKSPEEIKAEEIKAQEVKNKQQPRRRGRLRKVDS